MREVSDIAASDGIVCFIRDTGSYSLRNSVRLDRDRDLAEPEIWMFIDGQLVIDLGGLHGPLEATVLMDGVAPQIGLTLGQTYPMDIFHSEQHTVESNFRVETTIDCLVTVEPPPPPPPPEIR